MDEAGKTGTDIETGGIQEDFLEEVMFESNLHKEFVIQGREQRPGGGRVVCVCGGTIDMEGDNKMLGWVRSLLSGWGVAPQLEDSSQ